MRLKNEKQLEALRQSGSRLAQVMKLMSESVAPGISTGELDELAEAKIRQLGGIPIFKGYGASHGTPFPASICTSLNEEVVHGIPRRDRIIKEGDLVKIDMGLRFDGMVSDMARTFAVGTVSKDAQKILDVTRESLERGIGRLKIGACISDYAAAVQGYAESNGCSVVRELVGHGVGFELHEDPYIPNYVSRKMDDMLFREGMAVALEPMINLGKHHVKIGKDGWTFVTSDASLSAHFEDTVIFSKDGVEIVTR
ncbi:MAG: type I methionyl aminopeptidase [Candidatus Moranbacteria bacterium]|nr:type I methionyl aminopeptidase [Candidatus Moranbacteria bacterium]